MAMNSARLSSIKTGVAADDGLVKSPRHRSHDDSSSRGGAAAREYDALLVKATSAFGLAGHEPLTPSTSYANANHSAAATNPKAAPSAAPFFAAAPGVVDAGGYSDGAPPPRTAVATPTSALRPPTRESRAHSSSWAWSRASASHAVSAGRASSLMASHRSSSAVFANRDGGQSVAHPARRSRSVSMASLLLLQQHRPSLASLSGGTTWSLPTTGAVFTGDRGSLSSAALAAHSSNHERPASNSRGSVAMNAAAPTVLLSAAARPQSHSISNKALYVRPRSASVAYSASTSDPESDVDADSISGRSSGGDATPRGRQRRRRPSHSPRPFENMKVDDMDSLQLEPQETTATPSRRSARLTSASLPAIPTVPASVEAAAHVSAPPVQPRRLSEPNHDTEVVEWATADGARVEMRSATTSEADWGTLSDADISTAFPLTPQAAAGAAGIEIGPAAGEWNLPRIQHRIQAARAQAEVYQHYTSAMETLLAVQMSLDADYQEASFLDDGGARAGTAMILSPELRAHYADLIGRELQYVTGLWTAKLQSAEGSQASPLLTDVLSSSARESESVMLHSARGSVAAASTSHRHVSFAGQSGTAAAAPLKSLRVEEATHAASLPSRTAMAANRSLSYSSLSAAPSPTASGHSGGESSVAMMQSSTHTDAYHSAAPPRDADTSDVDADDATQSAPAFDSAASGGSEDGSVAGADGSVSLLSSLHRDGAIYSTSARNSLSTSIEGASATAAAATGAAPPRRRSSSAVPSKGSRSPRMSLSRRKQRRGESIRRRRYMMDSVELEAGELDQDVTVLDDSALGLVTHGSFDPGYLSRSRRPTAAGMDGSAVIGPYDEDSFVDSHHASRRISHADSSPLISGHDARERRFSVGHGHAGSEDDQAGVAALPQRHSYASPVTRRVSRGRTPSLSAGTGLPAQRRSLGGQLSSPSPLPAPERSRGNSWQDASPPHDAQSLEGTWRSIRSTSIPFHEPLVSRQATPWTSPLLFTQKANSEADEPNDAESSRQDAEHVQAASSMTKPLAVVYGDVAPEQQSLSTAETAASPPLVQHRNASPASAVMHLSRLQRPDSALSRPSLLPPGSEPTPISQRANHEESAPGAVTTSTHSASRPPSGSHSATRATSRGRPPRSPRDFMSPSQPAGDAADPQHAVSTPVRPPVPFRIVLPHSKEMEGQGEGSAAWRRPSSAGPYTPATFPTKSAARPSTAGAHRDSRPFLTPPSSPRSTSALAISADVDHDAVGTQGGGVDSSYVYQYSVIVDSDGVPRRRLLLRRLRAGRGGSQLPHNDASLCTTPNVFSDAPPFAPMLPVVSRSMESVLGDQTEPVDTALPLAVEVEDASATLPSQTCSSESSDATDARQLPLSTEDHRDSDTPTEPATLQQAVPLQGPSRRPTDSTQSVTDSEALTQETSPVSSQRSTGTLSTDTSDDERVEPTTTSVAAVVMEAVEAASPTHLEREERVSNDEPAVPSATASTAATEESSSRSSVGDSRASLSVPKKKTVLVGRWRMRLKGEGDACEDVKGSSRESAESEKEPVAVVPCTSAGRPHVAPRQAHAFVFSGDVAQWWLDEEGSRLGNYYNAYRAALPHKEAAALKWRGPPVTNLRAGESPAVSDEKPPRHGVTTAAAPVAAATDLVQPRDTTAVVEDGVSAMAPLPPREMLQARRLQTRQAQGDDDGVTTPQRSAHELSDGTTAWLSSGRPRSAETRDALLFLRHGAMETDVLTSSSSRPATASHRVSASPASAVDDTRAWRRCASGQRSDTATALKQGSDDDSVSSSASRSYTVGAASFQTEAGHGQRNGQ